MKKIKIDVDGSVRLAGGKKETKAVIDILLGVLPAEKGEKPQDFAARRDAFGKSIESALVQEFTLADQEIDDPETLEEAIEKLGREEAFTTLRSQVNTNQRDKLRNAEIKRRTAIAEGEGGLKAKMAEIMLKKTAA